MVYNGSVGKILIGSEDFSKLLGKPDINQYITFSSENRLGGRLGYKICNITVEVIPWMKGVLLVP